MQRVTETRKMVEAVHRQVWYNAYLRESSVFREVVALNQYDVEWLKALGIIAAEGMHPASKQLEDYYHAYRLESPLFDVVERQSKQVAEMFPQVYSVSSAFDQHRRHSVMTIAMVHRRNAIQAYTAQRYKGYALYRIDIKPDDVLVYIPFVEDFLRYYRREPKEGYERTEILRIVEQQLHMYRAKKPIWIRVPPERIVDRIEMKNV